MGVAAPYSVTLNMDNSYCTDIGFSIEVHSGPQPSTQAATSAVRKVTEDVVVADVADVVLRRRRNRDFFSLKLEPWRRC